MKLLWRKKSTPHASTQPCGMGVIIRYTYMSVASNKYIISMAKLVEKRGLKAIVTM
jgi:hypothetical protein